MNLRRDHIGLVRVYVKLGQLIITNPAVLKATNFINNID